ncbi:unnamed protein product, partial [Phaeothamnion confervicola]
MKREPQRDAMLRVLDVVGALDPNGWFADPVDPGAFPDYLDIVPQPMCLKTVLMRAKRGSYGGAGGLSGFCSELELVFRNCVAYNREDSEIAGLARRIIKRLPKIMAHEAGVRDGGSGGGKKGGGGGVGKGRGRGKAKAAAATEEEDAKEGEEAASAAEAEDDG